MIVKKIIAICPICDENILLDIESVKIEYCKDDILLSFKCDQCQEYVDKEAIEKELN